MKKILILSLGLAAAFVFSGCTMVTYTKSVSVKTDGNGKVIERVDFESITEPHQEMPKITSAPGYNLNLLK